MSNEVNRKPRRKPLPSEMPERIVHAGQVLLGVYTVAKVIGCTRSYVYRLLREERLPVLFPLVDSFPQRPFIPEAAVRAYVEKRNWWNELHGKTVQTS